MELIMVLSDEFYLNPDVVAVARSLLGKILITRFNGLVTSGLITETEAYAGITDRASHAFGGRRTTRTETMFGRGGRAYVYLCYGIHSLFNVVTNLQDIPHAVLVRGIYPLSGRETMLLRTGYPLMNYQSGYGPGKVTRLLGIHFSNTGMILQPEQNIQQPSIWIEDVGISLSDHEIMVGQRVGVDYAGEDANLPYRFTLNKDIAEKKIAASGAAINS
jgi:DNA-3-methyladenine glycosylase